MNTNTYEIILLQHYISPHELLDDAVNDEYHLLWYHCRDYAEKILARDINWYWLQKRIDDFTLLTTQHIIRRIYVWIWKAKFEIGSITKHLNYTKDTIKWISNRWVSVLKNLFDARYKYSIQASYIIPFDDNIEE